MTNSLSDLCPPSGETPLTIVADPVPLRMDEKGAYRVGKTRISLDSVIYAYNSGSTAQEIARDYPGLELADVHLVVGYYLRHRSEVDAYLGVRRKAADKLREEIEALPQNKALREKLIARRNEQA